EPHPYGNLAIVSDPADAEGTREAVGPLLESGAPAAVLFPGPVVPLVADVLTRAGFESGGALPAMAVDIDSLSATGLPAGYSLSQVGGGPDGEAWAEAFAAGYELPRGVADAFSPTVARTTPAADASLQYFAVRKGGRI